MASFAGIFISSGVPPGPTPGDTLTEPLVSTEFVWILAGAHRKPEKVVNGRVIKAAARDLSTRLEATAEDARNELALEDIDRVLPTMRVPPMLSGRTASFARSRIGTAASLTITALIWLNPPVPLTETFSGTTALMAIDGGLFPAVAVRLVVAVPKPMFACILCKCCCCCHCRVATAQTGAAVSKVI